MTLSNAAEIVFLAATVPVLLRVNHEHNGRTDGRTATMAIGRKQPSVAFPLKTHTKRKPLTQKRLLYYTDSIMMYADAKLDPVFWGPT